MAIKLDIYLKRTQQTMEDWMRGNSITRADELLPRCAYLGFAAGPADVAIAAQIFKNQQQAKDDTKRDQLAKEAASWTEGPADAGTWKLAPEAVISEKQKQKKKKVDDQADPAE